MRVFLRLCFSQFDKMQQKFLLLHLITYLKGNICLIRRKLDFQFVLCVWLCALIAIRTKQKLRQLAMLLKSVVVVAAFAGLQL